MKTKKDTRHETLKALHMQVIEAEGDYLEAIQKVKKAIAARNAASMLPEERL